MDIISESKSKLCYFLNNDFPFFPTFSCFFAALLIEGGIFVNGAFAVFFDNITLFINFKI